MFPRLYHPEVSQQCKISERCVTIDGQTQLCWAWRRPIRTGHESAQQNDLTSLFHDFKLTRESDKWNFTLNHSKIFTFSSLRQHLDNSTNPTRTQNKMEQNHTIKINIHS